MKELSIEEKAQRYDEAFRIAQELYNNPNSSNIGRGYVCTVFPELKENEDERIRKALLEMVHDTTGNSLWIDYNVYEEDVLAWLEKQGEQKSTDNRLIPQKGEYYVCIKDYYSANGKTTHTKGKIYKSPCDGYINDDKGFGLSWINSCTENHFRPVKEKDWIVCEQNNVIGKLLQYKEFMNELIQKNIKSLEDRGIVPNLRLWNIFDAKDGDILFAKGSYFKEYVFIYSGMTEDNVLSTYCGFDMVHNNFDTKLSRFGRVEDFETVFPATKEQREQLLKAMADAGYTFDFGKKELKKIEQKPAWSEEDEKMLSNIVDCIKNLPIFYESININGEDKITEGFICDVINWLKSLKPEKQWKPSDEQIKALHDLNITGGISYAGQGQTLIELYNNLKKL